PSSRSTRYPSPRVVWIWSRSSMIRRITMSRTGQRPSRLSSFPMTEFEIRIIRDHIRRSDLAVLAEAGFGDMVKAVVDTGRGVMAVGGQLHSDEEAGLLEDGSRQPDLWGINLYHAEAKDWFEFDSMINVRP